jgi:hypothetical protein
MDRSRCLQAVEPAGNATDPKVISHTEKSSRRTSADANRGIVTLHAGAAARQQSSFSIEMRVPHGRDTGQ